MSTRFSYYPLLGLIALFLAPHFSFAQGVLISGRAIDEPTFRLPRPNVDGAYRIRELSVDASINDQIARTSLTQMFENTSTATIEASFVFPLPHDGAIEELTFLVDGKELQGQLLSAEKAREIYQGYVRQQQDPALLEWIGTGMFKTSVFPIPAGETRTVTIRYSQLLPKDHRVTDFAFPLSLGKYSTRPIEKLNIRVAINSSVPIKNIYSPTHELEVQKDDDHNAVANVTMAGVIPGTDFRLFYDTDESAIGASVLSYWPEDADEGYFLLLASPEIRKADREVPRKTIVFVVDSSGSMSGKKIEQARDAAKFVLNNLNENDLFNIVSYSDNVSVLAPELKKYNPETRTEAIGFVNSIYSGGGTNIDSALDSAMKMFQNESTPNYVVFLTDGQPTVGEQNEAKIAGNCKSRNGLRARLISFGVGFDVNSRLLDRLSRDNFGQSVYVLPTEDIESSVSKLYRRISDPVLSHVNIDYDFGDQSESSESPVSRVYPGGEFDLFAGSQMVVMGRYKNPGKATIQVNGRVGDETRTFEYDVEFAGKGTSKRYAFAEKLWAMRRVGEIVDQIDLNGTNQELVDELVDLSVKHGIMTPYTAFLADENSVLAQLNKADNRRIVRGNMTILSEAEGESAFQQRAGKQAYKANSSLQPQRPQSDDFDEAQRMYSGRQGQSRGAGGFAGGVGADTSRGVGLRIQNGQAIYQRDRVIIAANAANIDLEARKAEIVEIARFSEKYFELVADNSVEENRILSSQQAGETLIVNLRGTLYQIN